MLPLREPFLDDAIRGDRDAFERLMDLHGPRIWTLCRRLDPDPEDAYQDAWTRALQALPRFNPRGSASFRTWLVAITHRMLVDRHRRRTVRGEVVPIEDLAQQADAEAHLDAIRDVRRLESALAALPGDQLRVVVLHHLEGLALESIADGEGVPVGTIKSRLHRGRARILVEMRR